MNDNNNGSLVDNIILWTIIMSLVYMFFLAIPIIPYFDFILNIIFSVFIPESFFGKILTGVILFTIGYGMLEFIKSLGKSFFCNEIGMYLFLYGQGLLVISIVGSIENGFTISKGFITIISLGFDEPLDNGITYIRIFGIAILIIGLMIEFGTKQETQKIYDNINTNPNPNTLVNQSLYDKLQVINNAEKLSDTNRQLLSPIESATIEKSKEYKKLFTNEELNNLNETLDKYKHIQ